MQAGRPYKDRLFSFGQWNRAIACSIPVNSMVRSPVLVWSIESCDRFLFSNSGKIDSYTRRLSPFPNDLIPSRPIRLHTFSTNSYPP